jgi:hypothetical protein
MDNEIRKWFTMTPTAQAAANATDMAAELMTATAISASMRRVVKHSTAKADATMAADETAIERPTRACIDDGGNVTAAVPAAATIDSVTVVPVTDEQISRRSNEETLSLSRQHRF